MGYTHYWYRPKEIDRETFRNIVEDFKRLLPELERLGVLLAGPLGEGEPILNDEQVAFNGKADCGHEKREIIIPWPAPDAGGVFGDDEPVGGAWFAGHIVTTRACNGDCSYESFIFDRVYQSDVWEEPHPEGWFDFCKTAFRPYDLAVTAFLVIAKHYLGDQLTVASDGKKPHWRDAVILCRMVLGYGDYPISEEGKTGAAVS